MMKTVLILTKTNWNEAPRIRHQVTRLLIKKGFNIIFVEKNTYRSVFIKKREEEGIAFFSHSELIHHQLRYFPFIQKLNNIVVKAYLSEIIKQIEFDFILNFSYEYSFLKKLAPSKKVITIIEDDFEAQAKFGMAKQIRNQIEKTCINSDFVLTTAYPLYDRFSAYKQNATLFFPWSQNLYKQPRKTNNRNTVLYFGYVGRLNWGIVKELVRTTNYHYRFIGPSIRNTDKIEIENLLKECSNFEYIHYQAVDQIEIDDVFCSLLPYNTNLESIQQCTVSNRVFNLLSMGLPLVYANSRHLLRAPSSFIRKNTSVKDYKESLLHFKSHFYDVQNDIESFLKDHYEDSRWAILEEKIAI